MIALDLYKHFSEKMYFLRKLTSILMISSNYISDKNMDTMRYDLDIIFNKWYNKSTSKSLLMVIFNQENIDDAIMILNYSVCYM